MTFDLFTNSFWALNKTRLTVPGPPYLALSSINVFSHCEEESRAGGVTLNLVRPKILSSVVKALYFQSSGRTNHSCTPSTARGKLLVQYDFLFHQYTIMLKMADLRRSDMYVVFTKTLCGRNFSICLVSYRAKMHRLASDGFTKSQSSI